MSGPLTWSELLLDELGPLLAQLEREGVEAFNVYDAARVLVLLARAEQLDVLVPLPHRGASFLGGLAERAPLEEPEPLLLRLEQACLDDDDEDPHGLLHDVLLELDDWLSVALFLEHQAVLVPDAARAPARERVVRRSVSFLSDSPERVVPLAEWASSRVQSLEPGPHVSEREPSGQVKALWQAVVDAVPVRTRPPLSIADLMAPLGPAPRRPREPISLSRLFPREASASGGIDLGPKPFELFRWDAAVLVVTLVPELRTPVLQVSRLPGEVGPQGTRDGSRLEFRRDEFGVWLAEARPGSHHLEIQGEAVEFILTD